MARPEKINEVSQSYLGRERRERPLAVFLILLFLGVSASWLYGHAYRERIYPGVTVGAFSLGGMTLAEAERTLSSVMETVRGRGLIFIFGERRLAAPAIAAAPNDPDLAYEMISYDIAATLNQAWAVGRTGSVFERTGERLLALWGQARIAPVFSWRPDKVLEILKTNFSPDESPGHNARLLVSDGNLFLQPEKEGVIFDYGAAINTAQSQLASLVLPPIILRQQKDLPIVTLPMAQRLWPQVAAFAQGGEAVVRSEDKTWNFSRTQLSAVLEIRPDESNPGQAVLGLSPEKLANLLSEMRLVLPGQAQEPKFRLENGRVVEFSPSIAGRTLDIKATARSWEPALLAENKSELALAVVTATPAGRIEDLNNLGIKELLGTGQSNFRGSPKNRRHNIAVGAAVLNGLLVAPGQEFSLLKALGEIDRAAGYLPELVIKGNRTVPEYGGGLCQIGTTIFRATLAAGLPITERRHHSYQVSYYLNDQGLPGTDATIYNPKPDYRFRNDTGNYLLIQTRIEGDNLFFDFWGTKDGRRTVQSPVRVWDRIPPGPAKLIETLDLPPGQKKCTEKPHAGIKAAFDYAVTYADGRAASTTFTSQYRPWQEVCLIGVEELSITPASSSGASAGVEVAPEDSSAAIVN